MKTKTNCLLVKLKIKKTPQHNQDSRVEGLCGLNTGRKVSQLDSEPILLHSSPSFSWAQARIIECTVRTLHKPHTKYEIKQQSQNGNNKKRQGSPRRKASWLLLESLPWKVNWWIRGWFHLRGHLRHMSSLLRRRWFTTCRSQEGRCRWPRASCRRYPTTWRCRAWPQWRRPALPESRSSNRSQDLQLIRCQRFQLQRCQGMWSYCKQWRQWSSTKVLRHLEARHSKTIAGFFHYSFVYPLQCMCINHICT